MARNNDDESSEEVLEIVLTADEINELVNKLNELKKNKMHLNMSFGDNKQLLFHHEDELV